jgi:endonuclease/exonuclease/phosphatase family metal-dependent hydrolase
MTYNILRGGQHLSALRDVVGAVAPDVLLVNESPKAPYLWRGRCRRLADLWDMRFVSGGRPAGSNMIAVGDRVQVKTAWSEVLRQPLFQPRRGIVAAQLRVEGRLVGVVSCHLSLKRDRRIQETERVIAAANRLRNPVVLAGDLNEPPDGPCWKRLHGAGFLDHGSDTWLTFPASDPVKRIDALLVRGGAAVVEHGDPGVADELLEAASDHRPVRAVLDI